MPSVMKRPAARMSKRVAAKEPAAKKPVADTGLSGHVEKLCNQVSDAILHSPEYPPFVKNMLANGVVGSLGEPKEKRHAFQDNTIDMVRQVLDSLLAAAQSKLDEAEKKLQTIVEEIEERQKAVEAAATALAERTTMLDAAKTRHSECTLARVAAKEALTSAEQQQTTRNAGLAVAELKKQRLESGMETIYGPLKRGETPAAEVHDGIKKIEKLGNDLGFDSSLLQSVPIALAKQPIHRSRFDTVVMSQIEAEFQRFMVTFTTELANGEPGKKDRAAKVEAAGIEHAQALAAEEAARNMKEAARTAHRDAENEHKALVKAQQPRAVDKGTAAAAVLAARGKLKDFDNGPLAAFKELLERTHLEPQDPALAEREPTPATGVTKATS